MTTATRASEQSRDAPQAGVVSEAAAGSGAMFDRVAGRYDLLNQVMSLGQHRRWRRLAVAALRLVPEARVLDLATGTADFALELVRQRPGCSVVGVDPSERMLQLGREKVIRAAPNADVTLVSGDAQALEAADDSFDACCIGFGIRNVPDRISALREMARVVRPGGRIAILELTEPRAGVLTPIARFHLDHVVPRLGAWLSGEAEYGYLVRSIHGFPSPECFAKQMEESGHRVLEVRGLTLGSVHLFVSTPSDGAKP